MKKVLLVVLCLSLSACLNPLRMGGILADYKLGMGNFLVKQGEIHRPPRELVDKAVKFAHDFWMKIYPEAVKKFWTIKYMIIFSDLTKMYIQYPGWPDCPEPWPERAVAKCNPYPVLEYSDYDHCKIRLKLVDGKPEYVSHTYSLIIHALSHQILRHAKNFKPNLYKCSALDENCTHHMEFAERKLGH